MNQGESMITIRELLNLIRWDREYGRGDFTIGYLPPSLLVSILRQYTPFPAAESIEGKAERCQDQIFSYCRPGKGARNERAEAATVKDWLVAKQHECRPCCVEEVNGSGGLGSTTERPSPEQPEGDKKLGAGDCHGHRPKKRHREEAVPP